MCSLVWLSLALTLTSAPGAGTLADAAESIAAGLDDGAALTRLRSAGNKGLWALADVAKVKTGAERGRVFEAIGAFAGPDAEWALVVELRKADPEAKAGVLRGVARLGASKLTRHVIEGLADPEPAVRAGALDAAVLLGARVRSDVLALLRAPEVMKRAAALRYVARVNHRGLLEEAVPVGLRDVAPEVQAEAIPLAVRSRDAAHAPALAKLARSADAHVAVLAVDALGALRGVNGAFDLGAIASDRASIEPAWLAAAASLRGLGAAGLPAFVELLERAEPERHARVVELFPANATDDELGVLVSMLADPRAPRASIARGLLISVGDRGSDVAFERLGTAPATERTAIVDFLASRAEADFAARLVERARAGAPADRLSAIVLLGELGEEDSLRALAPMLDDALPEVRANTAAVIVAVPDEALRAEVVRLARADVPQVRVAALRGLAEVRPRDPDLVRVGLAALGDPEDDVRLAALELLAAPTDPGIVRALRLRAIEALPRERVAIARALTHSRLPEAIVLLVDLATDIDPTVKAAAVAALGGRAHTPAGG
jgi:hypothetical protein